MNPQAHAVGPWQPVVVSDLIAETVGHVRLLRLDRPERKNAITSSLGWSIVRAVGDAHADDDVRVVALTGNGDTFCSGLDLGGGDDSAVDTGLSEQEQMLDERGWAGRFLLALRFETDKPVVAGINGAAVGAGLSLAMAADIRIAADTARLHPGYLRAGTSPDGGLTWSLPTLVGHETACASCSSPGSSTRTRRCAAGWCRRSSPPTSSKHGCWSSARPSLPRRRSQFAARSAWSPERRWSPTSRRE